VLRIRGLQETGRARSRWPG